MNVYPLGEGHFVPHQLAVDDEYIRFWRGNNWGVGQGLVVRIADVAAWRGYDRCTVIVLSGGLELELQDVPLSQFEAMLPNRMMSTHNARYLR